MLKGQRSKVTASTNALLAKGQSREQLRLNLAKQR